MKKSFLLVLSFNLMLNLSAQMRKGNFIFSIDGNYIKTSSETGVISNLHVSEGKFLDLGFSIGYKVSNSFVAGIGIDYDWSKEKRKNQFSINRFHQMEQLNTKTNTFLPHAYLEYQYKIINKLFLCTKLRIGYGKINTDIHRYLVGFAAFQSDTQIQDVNDYDTYSGEFIEENDVNAFNVCLCPKFTYCIFPKLGFSLGLGGIEYVKINWEKDYSSWVVNFHPNNWRFGVEVIL